MMNLDKKNENNLSLWDSFSSLWNDAFTKEMKKLVSDKKHLELLSDDFYIDEKLPIEFIYAYAFNSKDENGKEAERKSFIREQEKVCCMNYKVIYLNKGDFTLSDSNY